MSKVETLATLSEVTATYNDAPALHKVDLDLPEGKIIAFCGPNGSGKSTALRVLRGLHSPVQGAVSVAGRHVSEWNPRDLAREVAMLSQSPQAPEDMTVYDLALLGRYSHRGRFAALTDTDRNAVDRALAATNMTGIATRTLGQLSGGQIQRAWIAMVLAQEAPHIFLDEPTNHLDIAHALDILDLVTRLNRENGHGFVIVLHDLNLAMRYADHVVLFDDGRIAGEGPTQDVLREEAIRTVFEIDCRIITLPDIDRPVIVPLKRCELSAICAAE
ncbi:MULTISPECIES: ABC transporter ATP-binding protein [Halocynthiibacter]|uniref:ABC transporter ATP-binding protein n=1 Tax=Halocynthiibacter halioticoli TaxID=2986804 RepID=A0AAE3J399_9RHOB|nr:MULTISPECIES: ABC transporter ATP-binding protein [Halocynthiibacter]MCV6824552.1 ABC transporter ATP-binding protein [Halocynthiibacter halioticoli]MCW4057553.1 ABC transporter ATP-binding protein [Halocynthiibacter sp. SDUM655004]